MFLIYQLILQSQFFFLERITPVYKALYNLQESKEELMVEL